jgi:hypothetical protein
MKTIEWSYIIRGYGTSAVRLMVSRIYREIIRD